MTGVLRVRSGKHWEFSLQETSATAWQHLSDDEELLTQLFQYRFASSVGLNGHSLGNLLISALTEITGSFEEAVAETARVLAVKGQVLPSTLHDVNLVADVQLPDKKVEVEIQGESQIAKIGGKILRVWLEPVIRLPFHRPSRQF